MRRKAGGGGDGGGGGEMLQRGGERRRPWRKMEAGGSARKAQRMEGGKAFRCTWRRQISVNGKVEMRHRTAAVHWSTIVLLPQ